MAKPDRPNEGDPMDFIAIPIALIAIVAVMWMVHREGLYYGSGKMAYYLLWPFDFVPAVSEFRQSIVTEILEVPSIDKVFLWTSAAWYVPSVLFGCLCVGIAWRSWKHPLTLMRGPITVDALLRYQAQVHSAIAPIVPIAKDMHKNLDPRFHEAYHPHEFIALHGLALADGELDREKAEIIFRKQLGTRVYHPGLEKPGTVFADRLSDYEKTIFALLAPLAVEMKDGIPKYEKLCDAINYSAVNATQTPDLRLANELYKEYRTHPKLNNLFTVHHFSVTYLMQMYILAKRAGKIATSQWVGWLRPNANSLYAALNTSGRATPFAEAAGAFAQWKFEAQCAKKKRMPVHMCVVGAVEALQQEWDFWRKAEQTDSEDSLWGKMNSDQSQLDQDLFRRYVSEVLAPGMSAPPVSGEDTVFDAEQALARREHEEAEMVALMNGFRETRGGRQAGAAT